MNKWLRRGALAAATLAALGVATLALGTQLGERRMNRHIELAVHPVAWRSDAASIERGRYLYASRGCADCHGANGAGRIFIDDGHGMKVKGANISPGPGSVVANYRPEDWERTIRHGVKPDGRPLLVMPSEEYNRLTDDDLAALVAYVRALPPAEGTAAVVQFPALVKTLYGFGAIPDAAQKIDHSLPPSTPVPEGVTVEHGRYVAQACTGCHGAGLSGGKIAGAPPDWPAAANLTPGEGSAMARYATKEQFVAMLRSGRRPDGSTVSSVMPFSALRELNDTDASALHLYLKSLPARAAGER
ncbi:MAG TPA: cytochrome c [Ideonella sp.]|nr:cytochrome c [Ideonella sp.]